MYYENFEALCEMNAVKPSQVSKATGISTATLSSWKGGKYTPKADKLQKIADFFGVSLDVIRGEVDIRRDNETVLSDMEAFAIYLKNVGWQSARQGEQYELSNGKVTINVAAEKFEELEHDIRNKCVEGILKFVADSFDLRQISRLNSYADAFAAHQNESPNAGDSDFPEDDLSKLGDGK